MEKKAIEYNITATRHDFETATIRSSEDAVNFARNFYHDDIVIYESAFIILTNSAGHAIGYAKISQGGVCGTIVDTRIVAKYAIDSLAAGVLFLHNHPSGNTQPSAEDRRLSEKLREGLQLFDIRLLDSIIITEDSYLSMAYDGIL